MTITSMKNEVKVETNTKLLTVLIRWTTSPGNGAFWVGQFVAQR